MGLRDIKQANYAYIYTCINIYIHLLSWWVPVGFSDPFFWAGFTDNLSPTLLGEPSWVFFLLHLVLDPWPTHTLYKFFVGLSYYVEFNLSTNNIIQVYVFNTLLLTQPQLVGVCLKQQWAGWPALVEYLGKFAMPITSSLGGLGSRSSCRIIVKLVSVHIHYC